MLMAYLYFKIQLIYSARFYGSLYPLHQFDVYLLQLWKTEGLQPTMVYNKLQYQLL